MSIANAAPEIDAQTQNKKDRIADELATLEDELGRIPTPFDVEALSDITPDDVYDQFEMWDIALHRAGVIEYGAVEEWTPTEMLLETILDVAMQIEDTPTLEQVTARGPYSRSVYETRFGTWNNALEACGFVPNEKASDEVLLQELRRLKDEIGRTPRCIDMKEHGEFAPQTYIRRFDGWNRAVKMAGFVPNDQS